MIGKKKYQKAIADTAKIFEEKFAKQGQAFEKQSNMINEGIKDIKEVQDALIDIAEEHEEKMLIREKNELYGIVNEIDIAALDEVNKEIISGILYMMATDDEEIPNENQKEFALRVLKYMNITNPQKNITLEHIENVESITVQKAILQVIMEYYFLKEDNFAFMEAFDGVLEYFSINKRSINKIQEDIYNIYRLIGAQGIIEHYGYINIEEDELENDWNNESYYEEEHEIQEINNISTISATCADEISVNKYIELNEYLVYFEDDNLYRVSKDTGETKVIELDLRGFTPSEFSGDKNLVCYIDSDFGTNEEFVIINVDTEETVKYRPSKKATNKVSRFQMEGEYIYFKINNYLDEDESKKLFKLDINTLEVDSAKVDNIPEYMETSNEISIGSEWFVKDEKLYFIGAVAYGHHLMQLDHNYLYSFDFGTKELSKICEVAQKNSCCNIGEHITFIDNDILYVVATRAWEEEVEISKYDLKGKTKKAEHIKIKIDNLESGYVAYKDFKLFITVEDLDFPVYMHDINENKTTLFIEESDCGYRNVTTHLFKADSISYNICTPPQIVGEWLYYETDEEIKKKRLPVK